VTQTCNITGGVDHGKAGVRANQAAAKGQVGTLAQIRTGMVDVARKVLDALHEALAPAAVHPSL
jgi:hypothetical protein